MTELDTAHPLGPPSALESRQSLLSAIGEVLDKCEADPDYAGMAIEVLQEGDETGRILAMRLVPVDRQNGLMVRRFGKEWE